MIKAIIFDYDGVIVDSFPTVHNVYRIACKELGKYCPESFEEFRRMYGQSSKEFSKNAQLSEVERENLNLIYKREILEQNPNFFPGIKGVIQTLAKKYSLFVVSSNNHKELELKLQKLNVLDCFVGIVGGEAGPLHKTKPIIDLLAEQKLKPGEVIMVGDKIVDYTTAKECGINHIILVEYGWGYNKEEILEHKQVVLVHKPKDILRAIESIV